MIVLKSHKEIELMRKAGKVTAEARAAGGEAVNPGVTTAYIDDIIEKYIKSKGGKPSFKGYGGFPGSACISINDKVIHGIPSHETVIADGDIVSIDVGAYVNGFHGDSAATFAAGNISPEARKLIDVTRQCFYEGLAFATLGNRLGDIGAAISDYAHKNGFSVVYDYVGHGVGAHLHEEPSVPNYGVRGKGVRLQKGITIAIEPMINEGVPDIKVLKDGWTVITKDGKLSAHYEHTIAITDGEPLILTSL